jgi:type II secretory pathway pseudopilin PulG
LVEMIVAVAIFATVVLIAVGALLSIISVNRKANELRIVMENLNFAVESIARDVRTGERYGCVTLQEECDGSALVFEDQEGLEVEYTLDGTVIVRKVEGGAFIPVTSPAISIETLNVYVRGTTPGGDGKQPRVLMTIRGKAGVDGKNETEFSLQTSVSQRDTDDTE